MIFDLVGIGAGPFNLSLGILLKDTALKSLFLDKKTDFFGIMGVSIIGAVCHNMAQIAVAAFVVKNNGIYYYVPMLLIAGVITGGIIGVVSHRVLNILKK